MLNEQQQEVVVSSINQNCLIIAGAGSGKTLTLVYRIKHMLENGIKADSICLSTFTVEATHNMKERLVKICGEPAKDILIGTLDSISLRLLLQNAEDMVGNGFNKVFDVSEYGVMLLKFLSSHQNRMNVLGKIKYLIIDEYQDISETQFCIFQKFFESGTFITAVGDDAQNIYSFRGSDVSYILNFHKNFLPCQTFQLMTNYRSMESIVSFANHSILCNKKQLEKSMIAFNKGGEKPRVMYCNDNNHMKLMLLKSIQKFSDNGKTYKEVAILSRYKKVLYDLEIFLQDKNIPVVILENNKSGNNHVTLCTIHKSKGLEWNNCIIVGVHDDLFPKSKIEKDIEEERRLFYVAVTRAKKKLLMLFNKTAHSPNNKYAVSRFITEVPKQLYQHNLFPYNMPNVDFVPEVENITSLNVTSLIGLLNGNDYLSLREQDIISHVFFKKQKLHKSTKHSKFIVENGLETNFGLFIDMLICRMIKYQKPFAKKGRQLLSTIELSTTELETYNIYLSKIRNDQLEIGRLLMDEVVRPLIQPILARIYHNSERYQVEPNQVPVCSNENKIPDIFRTKINSMISHYENSEISWKELILSTFWLSQCGEIINGKKTILWFIDKINLETFNPYQEMFHNIYECYVNIYEDEESEVHSLWRLGNGMHGEIDVLHKELLVDWKVSNRGMQMEWIMQLLCYYYLGRVMKKKIDEIGIYNPLQGTLHHSPIGWWRGGEKLFEFFASKIGL